MIGQEILIVGKDAGYSAPFARILDDLGYGVAQDGCFDEALIHIQLSWPDLQVKLGKTNALRTTTRHLSEQHSKDRATAEQ